LLKARLKSHGPELAAVVGKQHRSFDAADTAKKEGRHRVIDIFSYQRCHVCDELKTPQPRAALLSQ